MSNKAKSVPERPPHIGLLPLPGNFHCRKWAHALARAGAAVTVFSPEADAGLDVVQIPPPVRWGGRYRYPSYLLSAQALRQTLLQRGVDVLHPLHVTPFGFWGALTGVRPMVVAALGADILEYPPRLSEQPELAQRNWAATQQEGQLGRLLFYAKNRFYRRTVAWTLRHADHITADNQALAHAMTNWFGVPASKITLLRWGVDEADMRFSPQDRKSVV